MWRPRVDEANTCLLKLDRASMTASVLRGGSQDLFGMCNHVEGKKGEETRGATEGLVLK